MDVLIESRLPRLESGAELTALQFRPSVINLVAAPSAGIPRAVIRALWRVGAAFDYSRYGGVETCMLLFITDIAVTRDRPTNELTFETLIKASN